MNNTSLYEKDFYAWTQAQAEFIKTRTFDKIDIANLVEEVEDMGNRHADEIESRLTILLMHLLKWKYQPNLQSRSWQITIKEQRLGIASRIKKMPSLKYKLPEIFDEAYKPALLAAEKETGLDEYTFPKQCPWALNEVLADEFFPT